MGLEQSWQNLLGSMTMIRRPCETKLYEIIPGYFGRFISSDNMTFVEWFIDQGAELPEHFHFHEQVVRLIEGSYMLVVDDTPINLEAGDVFVIASNARHSGLALEKCIIVDTFFPRREDYDMYLS